MRDFGTVVCVGGANVDRKATVEVLRPGTSNPVSYRASAGGVARNVAENLVRLGACVSLVTFVGDDPAGAELLSQCVRSGIDVSRSITMEGYNTGSYTAILDRSGELQLGLADMEIYDAITEQMLEERRLLFDSARFVFADTNLPAESIEWLIQNAGERGWKLVIDPVSNQKARKLRGDLGSVYCLLCNMAEAAEIGGSEIGDASGVEGISASLLGRGLERFAVTMGGQGVYCRGGDVSCRMNALESRVVEVTGAGDAFIAGTIWAFLNDLDFPDAARYGLRAAQVTIQTESSVSEWMGPDIFEKEGEQ